MKLTRSLGLLLMTASIVAACGSPKQATIEGYSSQNLNRTRVVVLLPTAGELTFADAERFGASRGVAGASAAETFDSELRTMLIGEIQGRLDSNNVMSYVDMPAAGIVPLSATRDFTATGPASWETIKKAGQEGAIDYLLVVRDIRVGNTAGADPRGDESVTAAFSLLDVRRQAVMTSGTISASVSAPRTAAATHERIAAELTGKLPFTVVE